MLVLSADTSSRKTEQHATHTAPKKQPGICPAVFTAVRRSYFVLTTVSFRFDGGAVPSLRVNCTVLVAPAGTPSR